MDKALVDGGNERRVGSCHARNAGGGRQVTLCEFGLRRGVSIPRLTACLCLDKLGLKQVARSPFGLGEGYGGDLRVPVYFICPVACLSLAEPR